MKKTQEPVVPQTKSEIVNHNLTRICCALADRFGRVPTEDEVMGFILGTDEERLEIWNNVVTVEYAD